MLAILSDEELGDKITMEQYYYNHMNKAQQAAYHSILSGVKNLADEFQIPALEGEELYNVFFQMRLDHPESCHQINPTHIPTAISIMPSILPINLAFLFPNKAVVSEVVNGSKTTVTPITIIPLPIMQLRLDTTP